MIEIKPGQNINFTFSDETGNGLTIEQVKSMAKELRIIVDKYGYDLSSYGSSESYERSGISRTMETLKEILLEEVTKSYAQT